VAEADAHARRRPLLTVDAEEEEDDDDEPHGGARTTVTTQELILAGRSDSLQAALASIALRIDALTSTTSTFRNLVSDRITDYAEQVGRLAASAAGDLDDYRHLHERALEQIRRSVGDAEDNVRRLSRTVGDLDAKVGALVAAVRESGDAVDQITSERDQVSDTVLRSLERVEETLSELTEGKGATSFARLGDMIAALTGERDRQSAVWSQLEQAVVALADDREHGADVLVRLERAVTEMTTGRERGLAKALARLEARIDEVATAMTGLSGDELASTLSRLDTRLKEMSTELVVGRDRETARALAQLSAQVDEIAGLVAEGRTDLSPIEARLNRMSRNVPPTPAIDLAELYARLDELAEAVAQQAPPDLSDLQAHLDQLARSTSPDPTWSTAMHRLERLLPALEGLRAGGGVRGEPPGSPQDRRELLERFDQLGQQLGEQLEALRRRIALRARPGGQGLDEETIAAIADAVVARLNEATPRRASMLPASSTPALSRPGPTPAADIAPERPQRSRDHWRNT
jgi:chromosome segregation ATPase